VRGLVLGAGPAGADALYWLWDMRYLVTARVKTGRRAALKRAVDDGTLGRGSVAGDEYFENMANARELPDGQVKWVETCFCPTPLAEERPYWEKFFELLSVKDAHARSKCSHENRTERWCCYNCDCTEKLEGWLEQQGEPLDLTKPERAPDVEAKRRLVPRSGDPDRQS
jgi:hypothetical protein